MARKSRDDSLLDTFCTLILDHQIGLSVNLLLLLFLAHLCFPRARELTRPFFELSYYDPTTATYTQGWQDCSFVAFWIIVFTGLRVAVMDYILKPFAIWGGITKRKPLIRFAEQAWLLLYYTMSWTLGMYIMYHSKYWFNLRELWTNFPSRSMSGNMKWYYLVQLGFWLQQILVVNIEEKRKDYTNMLTHHIITSALIITSYGYYQIKVGNAILCLMDVGDILLSLAKVLRYLKYQTACDVTFGVFIVVWFFARHIGFLTICWSIYADVPTIMPYGCYSSATGARLAPSSLTSTSEAKWSVDGGNKILMHITQSFSNPNGVVCFNPSIRYTFLGLLLGLQVITILWFSMILRIAWRVIQGNGADDSRSDDEESENEETDTESELEKKLNMETTKSIGKSLSAVGAVPSLQSEAPLEEEVGVEELYLGRRTSPGVRVRRSTAGSAGRATAISTTRDRKELLGRIGCDGPS